MKIAIVGTGIAGLTAGWLFNRAGHQVVLIERQKTLGLAAHGGSFSIDGESFVADVPPRMFNASLWPNLFRLYQAVGVEIASVEPSKSFGELSGATEIRLDGSFFSGRVWPLLFYKKARLIARDIRRMKVEVPRDLAAGSVSNIDFRNYLNQKRYSTPFQELFLFPALASTVCTCSYERLRQYPAEVVLHAMLSLASSEHLFRAKNGTLDVARRLAANIGEIRFSTSVQRAVSNNATVEITFESGESLAVDHLIVATQANSANKFLPKLTPCERETLDSFKYEDLKVVLHFDPSLMPKRRRDWSSFNVLTDTARTGAMCTVWMNRFSPQIKFGSPVFQTIMPLLNPASEKTICERQLQRPVVNQKSLTGLERLTGLHRETGRRIWFCGSYASAGVPLLESGVVSAIAIADALHVSNPLGT